MPTRADQTLPGVIAVGYSGGVDSTVLLHRLAALRHSRGDFELQAVHVNHGLSPLASEWESHCIRTCEMLDVPLTVFHADASVIRGHAGGLEAGAREARYGLILPWVRMFGPDAALALAHHEDDQGETFLLRALRGSSPRGLASMREWSEQQGVRIYRPLLRVSREQIIAEAAAAGLDWIEDPSNATDEADRNFLRLRIMPLLRERWTHVAQGLARSAMLSGLDADEMDAMDLTALLEMREDLSSLPMMQLRSMSAHRRGRLLRAWVNALKLPALTASAVGEFERTLLDGREDAQGAVEWSGHQLRVWRDDLYAVRAPLALEMAPREFDVAAQSTVMAELGNGSVLTVRNNGPETLRVRVGSREGGDKIRLPHRTHRSSVKNLLNESLPAWQRMEMPVVSVDGAVWTVGDALRSAEYLDWQERTGGSIEWQRRMD